MICRLNGLDDMGLGYFISALRELDPKDFAVFIVLSRIPGFIQQLVELLP